MIEGRTRAEQAGGADAAVGRLEADASAERRGDPDAAAGVAAGGRRAHARGDGRRGSAARSAGDARQIDRVARGAVERVDRGDAAAELVGVGLAEQHGAGAFELFDDRGVGARDVLVEQPRAGRGADAGGFDQIFMRDGDARQARHGSSGSTRFDPGSDARGRARDRRSP